MGNKKNYNIIRKISINEKDMITYLKNNKGKFNLIHLSNITDTMSNEESIIILAKHLNTNGKLVVWNNLVRRAPSHNFKLIEDITTLLKENRLATYYGSIEVYEVK